jgi:excisionase family DNA binding protein
MRPYSVIHQHTHTNAHTGANVRQQDSPRRKVGLAEGAAHAGVHTHTLRRWIAQGRLPAYRVGPRLIRVDLADIDALMRPVGGAA